MPGAEAGLAERERRQIPDARDNLTGTEDLNLTIVEITVDGSAAQLVQQNSGPVRLEPELDGDRRITEAGLEVRRDEIIIRAVE